MAKVIITVKDKKDGTVTVDMEFKPSIKKNAEATAAQVTAVRMLEYAKLALEDDEDEN